jgi:hypothetical protein
MLVHDPTFQFLSALMALYAGLDVQLEMRCLRPVGEPPDDTWPPKDFYPINPTSLEAAAKTAILRARHWDVYVGVLPRRKGIRDKSGVLGAWRAWCEIDGKTLGLNGAMARLEAALRAGLPEPFLVVASGGGIHCYWRLAELVRFESFEDVRRFEMMLRRLAFIVGGLEWEQEHGRYTGKLKPIDPVKPYADFTCCEIARILRVPGTFNHKPDRQCSVQLLHFSEDAPAWTYSQWRAWLPPQPQNPPPERTRPPLHPGEVQPLPPKTLQDMQTIWPDGQKYYAIRKILATARHCGFDEFALTLLGDAFCQRHNCDRSPVEYLIRDTMRRIHPSL